MTKTATEFPVGSWERPEAGGIVRRLLEPGGEQVRFNPAPGEAQVARVVGQHTEDEVDERDSKPRLHALVDFMHSFVCFLGHDLSEGGDQPESMLHIFSLLKRHDP
jgi:hypothetical protein